MLSATPSRGLSQLVAEMIPLEPPRFNYSQGRWATTRNSNVEDIASQWSNDPFHAVVFNDPKLHGDELVLLRKEMLDRALTPLYELSRGRAAVRLDVEIVGASLKALKHSISALAKAISENELSSEIANAALANLEALEVQVSRISATVVMSKPTQVELPALSDDEETLAQELAAEENS